MIEIPNESLVSTGWARDAEHQWLVRRSHDLEEYLWSEELDLASQIRSTFLQKILNPKPAAFKELGKLIETHAPDIGKLASDLTPPSGRGILTALKKTKAYSAYENAAVFYGKALSEHSIEEDKLFLIRSKLPEDCMQLISRDSLREAFAHFYLMRSLGESAIQASNS